MSGTKDGGKNAAETNKRLYGSDYYARIGAMGGKLGKTGGFYANRELARIAGAKGGKISKRGKKVEAKVKKSTPRDFGFLFRRKNG